MLQQTILNYNLIFRKEPEGGYTVLVPTLPGCITYGETLEEAKEMAVDAISLYLQSLKDDGEEIPSDEMAFITTVTMDFPISGKKAHA
jgi:predicted RNase H-like HicB family nuclease